MAIVNVLSEIPGTVWKIEAKVGDTLAEGDTILILESMKMEIPVPTSVAGVVTEILVGETDFVGDGDPVAAIEDGV